jgi:nicotinamide-nucleotide amidase
LAAVVHGELLRRGETVATAESLTAGLVGAELTTTPGASATYRGGLIVYASDLKTRLAGVPDRLLARRGAVDPEVATILAAAARDRLDATWGLGLTGVAGPDPQDGVAAGVVFVAVAGPGQASDVVRLSLSGDRGEVRAGAVEAALQLLYDAVTAPSRDSAEAE